jgi:hypothetical protein
MAQTEFLNGKVKTAFERYNAEAVLTDLEKTAIDMIASKFDEFSVDFSKIKMCRKSENYLSLVAENEFDFCRIKAGARSSWFSIHGLNLPDDLKNDSRFDDCNKKIVHWKLKLSGIDDLKDYVDLILESYLSIKDLR